MTPGQALAYWAGLAVIAAVAVYDLYWFAIDTAARLGLLPRSAIDFDIYAFVATMPVSANLFYYLNIACKLAGIAALLLRYRLGFYLLATAVGFHVVDWIGLAGNAYYDGSQDGTISAAIQLLALAALFYVERTQADTHA